MSREAREKSKALREAHEQLQVALDKLRRAFILSYVSGYETDETEMLRKALNHLKTAELYTRIAELIDMHKTAVAEKVELEFKIDALENQLKEYGKMELAKQKTKKPLEETGEHLREEMERS